MNFEPQTAQTIGVTCPHCQQAHNLYLAAAFCRSSLTHRPQKCRTP